MANTGTYQFKTKTPKNYPPLSNPPPNRSSETKSSHLGNILVERPCPEPSPKYEDLLTQFEDFEV